MRLRQLATSQSVTFFAPPEVHQSILDLRRKRPGDQIDSHDVICWLLEQTCAGIEQLQPLYFSQGTDFCCRTQAASDNPKFVDDNNQRNEYLSILRQPEQQTLEQLYEPKIQSKSATAPGTLAPKIAAFMKELNTRRKGFRDTANAVQGSALQEVEQEREVAFEVEAVREVQKPVHYSPLYFSGLHTDITHFVQTGRLVAGSGGYEQAFVSLRRTALGQYGIKGEATISKLYVSMEFTRTISMPLGRPNDDIQVSLTLHYSHHSLNRKLTIPLQRQVNWILWSPVAEAALIINPEEAELIIRFLFGSKMPPTYLLTYAAPVTRNMLHFNALHYYAIPELPRGWRAPSWLMIELGIFAGRLYFEYEEYGDLHTFLGLHEVITNLTETTDDTAELDGTEGLVIDDAAHELEIHPRAARQT